MTFYFGLNTIRNLTDISNGTQSLQNLNLNIKDLDKIRGISDPGGVSSSDLKTLSGLDFDLEKTATMLASESSIYNLLVTNLYDESSTIKSNLSVNGQFAATSIKYKWVDYDASNSIKFADISTSRVSSWSSFQTPLTAASPIFYGGEVLLEGPLELSSLKISQQVSAKRFESEIPTHKIKVRIDGTDVYMYAMKGIPLIFTGFFRTANFEASINQLGIIRPSWVVKNTSNSFEYIYQNRLSGSRSAVVFSDTSTQERQIQFYYPANNITALSLPSVGLVELPTVVLGSLLTLNISNNDIREFPNLAGFTSLQTLNIANNNLTRAGESNLRTLSPNIISRLPASITSLSLGNCFEGAVTANFSSLTNLISFDINAISRTNLRVSGVSPAVNPNTIENYNIAFNLFTDLDDSIQTSPSLKTINISYNGMTSGDLEIQSSNLATFYSVANYHNLINVANKTQLTSYTYADSTVNGSTISSDATTIFSGCTSLQTINMRYNTVTGPIPTFLNCVSLSSVDLEGTRISGTGGYAITNNTFNSCRDSLAFFRINSSALSGTQLQSDCIKNMPALYFFQVAASGITGNLPSFASAKNMRYVIMYSNALSGTISGTFSSNGQLLFLYLIGNQITGAVPNIDSLNLRYMYLSYNLLSLLPVLNSTRLLRLHLSFNKIPSIPDMSSLTQLDEFYMNNQTPVSGLVLYTSGSFVNLTSIRILNLSNNSMTQGAINNILIDLNSNYELNKRSGVVVNLKGNSSPSVTGDVPSIIIKLIQAGWSIQTD